MRIDNARVAQAVSERLTEVAQAGNPVPQMFEVDGSDPFSFPEEHRFCYEDGGPPTFTDARHLILFRPRYRAPGYPDSLIWDVKLMPGQVNQPSQPPRLPDAELIRRLREKPYSRVCREAADRLEELTRPR